jgi:hypothetical protein
MEKKHEKKVMKRLRIEILEMDVGGGGGLESQDKIYKRIN